MAKDTAIESVLKLIKDKDVKYVDLRFTDPRGKMQHLTMDISQMGPDAWEEGLMFDGSSIAGWKAINESDMILKPDAASAHLDPFYAQTTLAVFCDIYDPGTGEGYARDPRMIAKRAEAYLKSTKFGDTIYVLKRVRAGFARADADSLFDCGKEDLAVANATRAGGILNGFQRFGHQSIINNNLKLNLGQKIHHILSATVKLRVALLATKALSFGDRNALDPHFLQGFLHFIELERLNDGFDFLHV